MKRMFPTLATLVALSLAQAAPVIAQSQGTDSGQQMEDSSTPVQPRTDTSRSGGYPDQSPSQALTPPATRSDESGSGIEPYPHDAPGYTFGQTRPYGTSGGH